MTDLTIVMPTWNKDAYVREALESVFAQKTSYSFRVLVADDCSTDRTLEIADDFARRHPGKVEILTSERNQKLFLNVMRAYARLDTPYFCVLDGDDRWTDPLKIQRALDYLETHRDCTIFMTDTWVDSPDGSRRRYVGCDSPAEIGFDDYLAGRAICGCSLGSVFRNVVFSKGIPDGLRAVIGEPRRAAAYRGDAFRTILHLHEGRAHYEPVCDAAYRVTQEGLWQGVSVLHQDVMNAFFMCEMNRYFDGRHPQLRTLAARRLASVDARWAELVREAGDRTALEKTLSLYAEVRAEVPRGAELRPPSGPRERFWHWLYRRAGRRLAKRGILEG